MLVHFSVLCLYTSQLCQSLHVSIMLNVAIIFPATQKPSAVSAPSVAAVPIATADAVTIIDPATATAQPNLLRL